MNDDKTLVRNVLTGSSGAFEKLVGIHYPKLLGFICKMGLDFEDSENLSRDIFDKAYGILSRYDDLWEFSTWLYKIAVVSVKDFKKKTRRKEISINDIPEFLRAPEKTSNGDLDAESLNSLLSSIHDDDRSMLILHYYNKFSLKEIGRIYGLSIGSGKMGLCRAREALLRSTFGREMHNKCPYNENFIIKYRTGQITESAENISFEKHLKTCRSCGMMLESDRNLVKRIRAESRVGNIPIASIMAGIDKNAYTGRKRSIREYLRAPGNVKRLWRVAIPTLFAILLIALLAVPEISGPFWSGAMGLFNNNEQVVSTETEDNSEPPISLSTASGLVSGNELVGLLNEKGMGVIPWQVLYGDPSQMFIWNGNVLVGYREGGIFQAADLEGLNLNHAQGSIVTEFSFSTTGDFFIAGNSAYEGDSTDEGPGTYLFDSGSGKSFKISESYLNQTAFAWSIGGKYLAYADKKSGTLINILDLKTLKLTKITIDAPVRSLFISNSGGVSVYSGDTVMTASIHDAQWKTEALQNEPFYVDCDSRTVWFVSNGTITKHVIGSETDTVLALEPPSGTEDASDTFITSYRVIGNYLACRLKNGDAGLLNLNEESLKYMSMSKDVAKDYLPWCDATPQGLRLMLDSDGKFLILSGSDVTTVNIPGYSQLTPYYTRWIDDERITYVRMVDEQAPKAGEFSLFTINAVTGDIIEVFRSVKSEQTLNTPVPGSSDSISTKPGNSDKADKIYETDKATGNRVESFVVTDCKIKSGPGDNYADIGELGANEIVIYNSRIVNGWCLAQKVSGMLDYNDTTRNAFWVKADCLWLYDRYSLPVGIITADEAGIARVSLTRGNLIRIIMKGDAQSFVIPDTIDVNLGITGWIDNSSFAQNSSGVYFNQAYLKRGSKVYSEPDSQSEPVGNFTDFMASAQSDVFINLGDQSENGYEYALLPGGMAGWVSAQDVFIPGGSASTPAEPVKFDLNGDGVSDEINFNTDGENYSLTVNDAAAEGSGTAVQTQIKFVDVNAEDDYIEIVVEEYGASDDYLSTFYCYDGQNIVLMGQVQGLCGNSGAVAGDGVVLSQTRGNVLEAWFYTSEYHLNGQHKLAQSPTAFHEKIQYKDSKPLKLLIPELPFTKEPGVDSIEFVLKKDETVWFMGCDNNNWCRFETADGRQGWLQITGFRDISLAGITAGEAFEGLVMAD